MIPTTKATRKQGEAYMLQRWAQEATIDGPFWTGIGCWSNGCGDVGLGSFTQELEIDMDVDTC